MGAGGARDHFHADRGNVLGRKLPDQVVLVERVQIRDVDAALFQLGDLGMVRLAQPEHHVGCAQQRVAVGFDAGTFGGVGLIAEAGTGTGTGLNGDVRTQAHQFLYCLGSNRRAVLTGVRLTGYR